MDVKELIEKVQEDLRRESEHYKKLIEALKISELKISNLNG